MTDKENEFYENLKNDPGNPMFDILFEKDSLGNIIPKTGMTFKLMSDGVPFVMSQSTASLYGGHITIGDLLERVRANKSFENISNEAAMESPLGKKSAFYVPPKEDFSLTKKYRVSKGLKRN